MREEALEHLLAGIVDHKDDGAVQCKELRRGEIIEVRVTRITLVASSARVERA